MSTGVIDRDELRVLLEGFEDGRTAPETVSFCVEEAFHTAMGSSLNTTD